MKVFNLRCAQDHRFEGWFGSEADYDAQLLRGLVTCPLCADATVSRLPTAPHLVTGERRAVALDDAATAEADVSAGNAVNAVGATTSANQAVALQSAWMQAVAHVLAHTVDVGDRFAEEARRIHYGEVEERAIRGRASSDDARALRDEGIDVTPLPVPEPLKGPTQ